MWQNLSIHQFLIWLNIWYIMAWVLLLIISNKNRSRYQTPHQIRRFTELVTLKNETIAEQFDDLITPNPAATFRILLTDSPLLLVIKALHGNLVWRGCHTNLEKVFGWYQCQKKEKWVTLYEWIKRNHCFCYYHFISKSCLTH